VGPVEALWVQAAGFLVAALLFLSIRTDLGPEEGAHAAVRGASGVALVVRDRVLRRLTAVGMAWNLVVNLFYALIVVYVRVELHAGGPAAGRMLAVGGLAGLAGGAAAPAARARLGATRALRTALVLNAAAAVGLAVADGLVAATIAFGALEATAILFVTMLIGERQVRAAPSEQARVGITGRMSALLAASTGAVVASALVAMLSPSQVFAIAAAATAAVAAVSLRALRVELV
jgi:predicted MFS family arabinose efflux permease